MLRKAENSPRVLYTYSSEGGEFLVSLAEEGVKHGRMVDTDEELELPDSTLTVQLQPEEAKVFVLD
jgi:hypothetical protein